MNSSNKTFGITFSILLLFFGVLPFFKNQEFNWVIIILSLIILILGLKKPSVFGPPNKFLIWLGFFAGKFIAPIALYFIYFAIIFPTKIVLLLFKKDILNIKIDYQNKLKSYWINEKNENKSSMDWQY